VGSQYDIEAFAQRLHVFMRQAAGEAHGDAASKEPAQIVAEPFEQLALELFALQYKHNPPYRAYCQRLGRTPADVEHWSRIPPVPTASFKEFELTCLSPHERTTVFYSSGTTGQHPSRHFHSAGSLALYEASLLPWFRQHLVAVPGAGIPGGLMRIISLTPPIALAPHSSLAHMCEVVVREFGTTNSVFVGHLGQDGSWELDQEKLLKELTTSVAGGEPVVLLGTAFLFVHLLEHFGSQLIHLKLPTGSRLMETGGYKGRSRTFSKAEFYDMLTTRLGIEIESIVGEYGMSELSSQAYDLAVPGMSQASGAWVRPQRLFRFPPWARARIVSPETGREVVDGECGTLLIFDLANAWSVLAVQTEDIGIRRGSGFELLGRLAAAEPRGCSLMSAEPL
jgi:hypothetical protein